MKIMILLVASALTLGGAKAAVADNRTSDGADSAVTNASAGIVLAQFSPPAPRGGVGTARPPRDQDVPLPGSGRVIPTSAADAAKDSWTGCRPFTNRFREPFRRCCSFVRPGLRACNDHY